MRKDMFKVIVERPRGGTRRCCKQRFRRIAADLKRVDWEEDAFVIRCQPQQEGIKKMWRGGSKYLNEHLGPLKQFLSRNVGRKWDDVFSEICEHIKLNSTVQRHVREHLEDFVSTTTWLDGKREIWCIHRWNSARRLKDISRVHFYVDLRDGILKSHVGRGKKTLRKQRMRCIQTGSFEDRIIDKHNHYIQYHLFQGCWFRVHLVKTPPRGKGQKIWDAWLGRIDALQGRKMLEALYRRKGVYASHRRVLSSVEKLRLRIRFAGSLKEI